MIQAAKSEVTVKVMGFAELFEQGYQLKLDNYQRAYVWSEQKVRQLLSDLSEFSSKTKEPAYYMGTLLLHQDDNQQALFVIDGQQRLSSLAVIFHSLTGKLPKGLDFHYRSPISSVNLKRAQKVAAETMPLGFDCSIFEELRFTVITVSREDLAFTFFDTQNNRGVPLKATDLLKAFHLRAVNNSDPLQSESLQQHCARRWEAVQVAGSNNDEKHGDFAPALFHQYLWRARNWRGQKQIEWEDHEKILQTFQDESVRDDEIDSLPLYPGNSNQFASRLCLQSSDDYRLDIKPVQVSASAATLPFSLRQPIHQGAGFFLYAQKYAALLDELLHQTPVTKEVISLRSFYRRVVEVNSHYLRELFNLALLMYVDRFGYFRMMEFAQRTEMVLGGLRIEKQYVFKEASLKYLREAQHNVLDVIAGAYRPDEVMAFLRSELARIEGYSENYVRKVTAGKGVQGRYLAASQAYYQDEGELPSDTPPRVRKILLCNMEGNCNA